MTPPRLTTRRGRAQDAALITCLHDLTHQEHALTIAGYDGEVFAQDWVRALTRPGAALRERIKPSPRKTFVAHYEGEFAGHLLGAVQIAQGGVPIFFINDLSVAPDFRRQGLGTKLIQAGENGALAQGVRVFATGVWRGNTPSQALFAKAGYTSWPQMDEACAQAIGHYIRSLPPKQRPSPIAP